MPLRVVSQCGGIAVSASASAQRSALTKSPFMESLLTTASLTNLPILTLPSTSFCLLTSSSIHVLSCLLHEFTWCCTSSAPPPLTSPATTLGLPSSTAAALIASLLHPCIITCFKEASSSWLLISSSLSASPSLDES